MEAENNTHSGFSERWLKLREPADHAARSGVLTEQLISWAAESGKKALRILELGSGTGSNIRYLMPHLGHNQQWTVLDNDANLIAHLPLALKPWADINNALLKLESNQLFIEHQNFSAEITCRVSDIAANIQNLCEGKTDLITASALLDLTSAQWLDNLANIVNTHRCASLFALNYDGSIQWQPLLDSDSTVTKLLNAHQLSEKGFGKALGPSAGQHYADALAALNHRVICKRSGWLIEPQSNDLQAAIIDGWKEAAIEQSVSDEPLINDWHTTRAQAIRQKQSTLRVGHVDVLSLPQV